MIQRILLLSLVGCGWSWAEESAVLRWVGEVVEARVPDLGSSEKRSLSDWQRLLSVRVIADDISIAVRTPPMAGSYELLGDMVRFTPQFPLQPGARYLAECHDHRVEYAVPRLSDDPSTVVSQIYPTASVLPENLLKFYLHFSSPMSRGGIYAHIHLQDERGQDVEIPFLEIDEELWNPEMTRLTLFIDPGRIKREVKPLEEVGPSLTAGKSYKLIIASTWQDAVGLPLRESFEKTFRVGPVDRTAPDVSAWEVQAPLAKSLGELRVRFAESMDHALSQRLIQVWTESGKRVAGSARLGDEERLWFFQPEVDWLAGDYHLRVFSSIEDLAGNQPGKAFEVDLFEEIDDQSLPKVRWEDIAFVVE